MPTAVAFANSAILLQLLIAWIAGARDSVVAARYAIACGSQLGALLPRDLTGHHSRDITGVVFEESVCVFRPSDIRVCFGGRWHVTKAVGPTNALRLEGLLGCVLDI